MKRRIALLMCIFLFMYAILGVNMFYYQIIRGSSIAREAVAMRSRNIALKEYPRAGIYDRNLLPLTDTIVSNALYCLPGKLKQYYTKGPAGSGKAYFEQAAALLADALHNQSQEDIVAILQNAEQRGEPLVRIATGLENAEIEKIKALNLNGIVVAPLLKRYRENGFAAHLLGYVGSGGNSQGKAGLEKIHEEVLQQDSPGYELVSIHDARGKVIQGLEFKIKKEQHNIGTGLVLTIDQRVQELVEMVMNRMVAEGAVVVMDIESREVLAMASRPVFNPYDDIAGLIANDRQGSLINRALSRYHPGSLFKILVAAAAIEEGIVNSEDRFFCKGIYEYNEEVSTACWKEGGHGNLIFSDAFALSCNPVFIELGLSLGKKRLLKYVNAFHLTDENLIGLNKDWNYAYVDIASGEPALGNACLGGQGVMLTPLQLASMVAVIADGGCWQAPLLVKSIAKDGSFEVMPRGEKSRAISSETAAKMRELMKNAVNKGTGQNAALAEVGVGGKTATSQTGAIAEQEGERQEILNTWFAGFFPSDNPQWVIVVLAENGQTGSENAAPVFREIAQGMLKLYSIAN